MKDPEQNNNTQLMTALSGIELEQSSTDLILSAFSTFDEQAAEWADKASALVVTEESQVQEMKEARVARLALRKIRTEADKKRKELKAESLRYGKAVQGVYNFLEYKIKPIEEHLQKQEDFAKIKAEEKLEKLRSEREAIAEDLREFIGYGDDLGVMSQVVFDAIIAKAKKDRSDQIAQNEAALKAQAEAEERARLEQIRIREENERLRAENEAKEAALKLERELVAAEKAKAEKAANIEREKAEKERRELEAELEKARATEQARKDREKEAEHQRRREAEQALEKARTASDKVKVQTYLIDLESVTMPKVESVEARAIIDMINQAIGGALLRADNL